MRRAVQAYMDARAPTPPVRAPDLTIPQLGPLVIPEEHPDRQRALVQLPAALFGAREPSGSGAWAPGRVALPDPLGDAETEYQGWLHHDPATGVTSWRGMAVNGEDLVAHFHDAGHHVIGWWETASGTWEVNGPADAPIVAQRVGAPEGCGVHTSDALAPEPTPAGLERAGGMSPGDVVPSVDVLVLFEEVTGCVSSPTQTCSVQDRIDRTHGAGQPPGAITPAMVAAVGVGKIQDAMSRSGVGAGIRLVGVQPLNLDIPDAVCPARNQIQNTGSALFAAVSGARDAVGADVVVVLSATQLDGNFTGCASNPTVPSTATANDRFAGVLKVEAGAGVPSIPSTETSTSWTL
jgi:hypothetical protein